MVSISALQSAVEALAEGRLAEAEERFMAILLSDPANAMANCGLKDVVHARILANHIRPETPPARAHRSP